MNNKYKVYSVGIVGIIFLTIALSVIPDIFNKNKGVIKSLQDIKIDKVLIEKINQDIQKDEYLLTDFRAISTLEAIGVDLEAIDLNGDNSNEILSVGDWIKFSNSTQFENLNSLSIDEFTEVDILVSSYINSDSIFVQDWIKFSNSTQFENLNSLSIDELKDVSILVNSYIDSHNFFNEGNSAMFVLSLIVIMIILYEVRLARNSSAPIFLRSIPGLKAVEEAVGRSTEMGRPILYVPGIMDMNEVETVAGVVVLGHVANMTAQYETELDVPVARAIVMQSARQVTKEAYLTQGRPEMYNEDMVHYITDDQFAYAAAVNGIMQRDEPAACLYMGKFFAESLLFAETGNSIGAIQIAGTGSQTQIPFFVTACDYTLMGEEFFAASAYLSKEPELIAGITALDIIKVILIGFILLLITSRTFFDLGFIDVNLITWLGL